MAGFSNTLSANGSRLDAQNFLGLSVGDVRDRFADTYNIGDSQTAYINGLAVSDEQILVDGEEITFAKPLGQKG